MIGGLLAHGIKTNNDAWRKLYTAPEGKVATCTINYTQAAVSGSDFYDTYTCAVNTAVSNHIEGPSADPNSVLGVVAARRTAIPNASLYYGHPASQRTGVIVPGGYSVWVRSLQGFSSVNIYGFVSDLPKNTSVVKVADVTLSNGLTKLVYTCPESKIATVNVYLAPLSSTPTIILEARDSDQSDETQAQYILGPTYFADSYNVGTSHIYDRIPGAELTGLVLRSGQKLYIKNTTQRGSVAINVIGFETTFAD